MAHPMISRIARWRFERPLAAALGVSILFAVAAMPPEIFALLPLVGGAAGSSGQFGVGLLLGVLLGGAAWVVMQIIANPLPREAEADPIDEAPEIAVPAQRLVRLRRADAHPDAPPREPIRAIRDLGTPFMAVGNEGEDAPAVADADYEEVTEPAPVEQPLAAAEEPIESEAVVEATSPVVEPPAAEAPIAADEPLPASAPVRLSQPIARDASLGDLVERLAAGVERRGGQPPRRPASHPQLRAALEELNRLAGRRA